MPACTTTGSVAELIESMRQCRLLSSSQLEELSELRHADPRTLGHTLIERGMLTHYQVNLLLQGRSTEMVLEPYLVLARLGEGGSGLVLKARHRHMQRIVAIKLIRKSLLTDSDVVARFQREIEVASQVSHSNVVHAFDAGPMGGTLGLAWSMSKAPTWRVWSRRKVHCRLPGPAIMSGKPPWGCSTSTRKA